MLATDAGRGAQSHEGEVAIHRRPLRQNRRWHVIGKAGSGVCLCVGLRHCLSEASYRNDAG